MPKPNNKWLKAWALKSGHVSKISGSCTKSAHGLEKTGGWGEYQPEAKGVSSWTCLWKKAKYNHSVFWARWGDEKVYIDATVGQFGAFRRVYVGTREELQAFLNRCRNTSEVTWIADTGSDAGMEALYRGMFSERADDATLRVSSSEVDMPSEEEHVFQTLRKSFERVN